MKQNIRQSLGFQLSTRGDATVNCAGGLAFQMPAMNRLMTRLFASLAGENKAYTDGNTSDAELCSDVREAARENPELVLRLAAFARQEMNIRSTPIVVLGEAAALPEFKGNGLIRRWTPEIVRRADEPGEAIAYWIKRHGSIGTTGAQGGDHAFPNGLTRGLEDALRRFDEYQYAKYDRDASVKLRDVLRIVRPHPRTEAESALYRYLVKGDIDAQYLPKLAAKAKLLRKECLDAEAFELAAQAHATWEVLSSKFGRSKETWNALAAQLPIMAGIRNLSNILEVGADNALDTVLSKLRDPHQVRRSHQLPFRFYAAYKAIERRVADHHPRRQEVLEVLRGALEFSAGNLPHLPGRTFVTTDLSGSMSQAFSKDSTVHLREIGCLMAAALHSACDDAIVSVFGTDHRVVSVSRQDSILTNMDLLHKQGDLGGTDAWKTVAYLNKTKTRVDRIVLFSDMQCYDSGTEPRGHGGDSYSLAEELRRYRSSVNPDVHMVSVDLAGYGTSQFPTDDPKLSLIAGWSDRVLELIALREAGVEKVLETIARWQPFGEAAPKVSRETDDGAEA